MAARVNVKFVILLSAALVMVGIGAITMVMLVTRSGADHERAGDKAMQEQRYGEAKRYYAKAVRDDQNNVPRLEKWLDSIQRFEPTTRSAYRSEYLSSYLGALGGIARAKRTDVDAHRDYLDVIYRSLRDGGGRRESAENLAAQTEQSLAYFGETFPDPSFNVLRRYRALGLVRGVVSRGGELGREERRQAEGDLEAVLEVDPADGEVATALTQLLDDNALAALREGRDEEFERIRTRQRSIISAVLAVDANDPWAASLSLSMDIEDIRRELPADRSGAERTRLLRERTVSMHPVLDEISELLKGLPARDIDPMLLERLEVVERVIDPDREDKRIESVLRALLEEHPEDEGTMLRLARLIGEQGEYEEAISLLERTRDLPMLPVGLDGLLRFGVQSLANRWLAEYNTRLADQFDEGSAERLAAIANAEEARASFGSEVSEDAAELLFLDGLILRAKGDGPGSLQAFSKYNAQTIYMNPRGLWFEGSTAKNLGEVGLALDRLTKLVEIQPTNLAALIALAEIEESRNNLDRAMEYAEGLLSFLPDNPQVQGLMERLQTKAGLREADDPVMQLVLESRRVLAGTDDEVGDAAMSEQILVDGLGEHDHDPRIGRELITRYLNSSRLAEATAVAAEVQRKHPTDEGVNRLMKAFEQGDLLAAIMYLIDESDRGEAEKLREKRRIYLLLNRSDLADDATKRLLELAPNDILAIEYEFVRRIREEDLDGARELAARAADLDADRVGGRTFEARLLSLEGKHDRAAEILEEAVAEWSINADIWRMLAAEQISIGQREEAIESYKKALEISPDNPLAITEYVQALGRFGRPQEALEEARRLRRAAERNPAFLEFYLQLEATLGGEEGIRRATEWRRRVLTQRPEDRENRAALADLYIQNQQWLEARALLDQLREDEDNLFLANLDARWHADQGRVRTENGLEDGLELARGIFIKYILDNGEDEVGVDAYLAMSRFMFLRGAYTTALNAAAEARRWQDPEVLQADRAVGNMMMQLNRPGEALEMFQKVVDAGADTEAEDFAKRLAEMHLRLRQFDEAAATLEKFGPEAAAALSSKMQWVDVHIGREDRAAALELLDSMVTDYRQEPAAWAKRAQVLASDDSRVNDAMADLEEALRLDPDDWRSLRLRSALFYRQDRVDEALQDLRQVLTLNPDLDEVMVGLMIELISRGRDGVAVDVANEVIEQRESDVTLMLTAAQVFTDRGYWSRASQLLKRAWDQTQSPAVGVRYIDSLLNSDEPKTADADRVIERLALQGETVSNDPIVLIARALIEMKRDRPARAEAFMTRSFERGVESPSSYMNWILNAVRLFDEQDDPSAEALALARKLKPKLQAGTAAYDWLEISMARVETAHEGYEQEGMAEFDRISQEASDETVRLMAYRLLGSARYSDGDHAGAAEAWADGLVAFPDDWEMTNNLAYCYTARLGDAQRGLPLAERATELAPNRGEGFDTLARTLIDLGRFDEAEEALDTAETLSLGDLSRLNVVLNRASLSHGRGDCEQAKRYLTEAESTVATMPQFKSIAESDIEAVREKIDSDC